MKLQFDIEEALIQEAIKMGNHSSAVEAVTAALNEYVRTRHRLKLLDFFGTVPFHADYDYKALRHRKRR